MISTNGDLDYRRRDISRNRKGQKGIEGFLLSDIKGVSFQ